MAPTPLISFTADFYPADLPEGCITWTFVAHRSAEIGAGVYEVRFVRPLTAEERERKAYSRILATEAV